MISLGVTPAIAVTILPALLDVTSVDQQEIEWNALQAAALPLIEMLLKGRIEAALIYHNPAHKDLLCLPILSEDMVIVGLPSVLGNHDEDFNFQDLNRIDLVLDQKSHMLRQVIEGVAGKERVTLRVQAEVNPLPAKQRLLDKSCCTIIPKNAFAREIQNGTYVARRVVCPSLPVTLFLLCQSQLAESRIRLIHSAIVSGMVDPKINTSRRPR